MGREALAKAVARRVAFCYEGLGAVGAPAQIRHNAASGPIDGIAGFRQSVT